MTAPALALNLQWRPIDRGDACKCGQLMTVYVNQFGGTRERCEPCDRAKRIAAAVLGAAANAPTLVVHREHTPSPLGGYLPAIEPGALRCQVCAYQAARNAKGVWARFCVGCAAVRRAAGPRSRRGVKVDMSLRKTPEYQAKQCRRCPVRFTPTDEHKFLCSTCRVVPYERPKRPVGAPRTPAAAKRLRPVRFCACGSPIEIRRGRPRSGCDACIGAPGSRKGPPRPLGAFGKFGR